MVVFRTINNKNFILLGSFVDINNAEHHKKESESESIPKLWYPSDLHSDNDGITNKYLILWHNFACYIQKYSTKIEIFPENAKRLRGIFLFECYIFGYSKRNYAKVLNIWVVL